MMFFNRVPLSSAVAPVADQAAVPHEFPDVPDEAMDIQEEDEQAEAPDDDGDGVGPVMNADVPAQGHVVVNGIELHLGGKATVLQRIEQHLRTQKLLQQHEFQTDGVELPLEQKFVEEPAAEQRRRHELSHDDRICRTGAHRDARGMEGWTSHLGLRAWRSAEGPSSEPPGRVKRDGTMFRHVAAPARVWSS
eukprot:s2323_g8.t1